MRSVSPETLPLLDGSRTRSITPENPTGEPGQGGRAHPDSTLDSRATNARAADSLGQGWKVRPFIAVQAGETVTLMDARTATDVCGRVQIVDSSCGKLIGFGCM